MDNRKSTKLVCWISHKRIDIHRNLNVVFELGKMQDARDAVRAPKLQKMCGFAAQFALSGPQSRTYMTDGRGVVYWICLICQHHKQRFVNLLLSVNRSFLWSNRAPLVYDRILGTPFTSKLLCVLHLASSHVGTCLTLEEVQTNNVKKDPTNLMVSTRMCASTDHCDTRCSQEKKTIAGRSLSRQRGVDESIAENPVRIQFSSSVGETSCVEPVRCRRCICEMTNMSLLRNLRGCLAYKRSGFYKNTKRKTHAKWTHRATQHNTTQQK